MTPERFFEVYGPNVDLWPHFERDLAAVIRAAQAEQRQQVLAWLGYWRDKMPSEAVSSLQDILTQEE